MIYLPRWLCILLAMAVCPGAFALAGDKRPAPSSEQLAFFESKIRPVLAEHCYRCHSSKSKRLKAELRLDSSAGILAGGESGPVLVPGNPGASALIKALRFDDLAMPPSGKLPDRVIAHFEIWIKNGAAMPEPAKTAKNTAKSIDVEKGKEFWAFQPPRAHPAPSLKDGSWPKKKIDSFILAELEKAGLRPAAPADRRIWIRRVTFDLTGLPPTPEEVDAFLADESDSAFEQVVERLLASPHYGERWARMWLDVARYAEDQAHIVGNNKSLFYPNAYLYRDWVIKSLNDDMPYDRFVELQLAADLLEPGGKSTHLAALGYLGLGPKYYQRNSLQVMSDEWEDRIDVVGRGLLGLTVACARCHDHKYDPIPTADYYALAGVFASTQMHNQQVPELVKKQAKDKKANEKKAKGKKNQNDPQFAMHIVRDGPAKDLNVFLRGNVNAKGPVEKRHFLTVLSKGTPENFTKGSGRLELAQAIADRNNPLTARVIVNRIWGLNFGKALVATPSNFGVLGARPSHPQLLDDLAVRFMENGWSLKWLQREIVLSATYRQGSQADQKSLQADQDNRLFGRMNRRRLSIESWRDAMLAVGGTLDPQIGGKSIDPQNTQENRRTLYSYISRLDLNPMLAAFDFPDPNAHSSRRVETTTPLQKMFVLNSPFMVHQANALSERLLKETPGSSEQDDRQRLQRAYALLFGRPARPTEADLGLSFLRQGSDHSARWQQFCHVLLASNEMLYVD